ncbi:MAG: hypothetical protein EOP17_01010 [Rhizobiaceae bacterium]|nr:MAG: hypothetical protein EOP17_01010 [Rhizobiaceae bacterium]
MIELGSIMMRALFLALCVIAAPAHAGVRATYLRPDGGSTIIEVADSGDARIGQLNDDEYGLLVQGRFYMVEAGENRTAVMSLDDIATAAGMVLPRDFGRLRKSPRARPGESNLESDGAETVAGRVGSRFRMRHSDSAERLVVSDDPALRPVGAAMEGIAVASVAAMGTLFGDAMSSEVLPHIRDMFARGAPLKTFDGWTLTTVEDAEISRDRVALPGVPLSAEDVVLRLRTRRLGR